LFFIALQSSVGTVFSAGGWRMVHAAAMFIRAFAFAEHKTEQGTPSAWRAQLQWPERLEFCA